MKEAKTYGLTHLAITVKDIDRTLRFYQHVFDMEVMYRHDNFLQLTTPGCQDILVFEKGDETIFGNSGSIKHFGFRLKDPKDIGYMENKVKEAGGTIIEAGEFVPGSPYVFFKDPDGYEIEIWYEI